MSQQLDRGRQLWEAWAVVGLGEGRFALIVKSHHCMTDGVVAVDLATVLLRFRGGERRSPRHLFASVLSYALSVAEVLVPNPDPLRCFRGIDRVTAMTVLAEFHDFRRFRSRRELMAYLGLVPSEYSSGGTHRRGGRPLGWVHAVPRHQLGDARSPGGASP